MKRKHPISKKIRDLQLPPATFETYYGAADILDAVLHVIRARQAYLTAFNEGDNDTVAATMARDRAWTKFLHKAIKASAPQVLLAKRLVDAKLNRTEREIVLVLILGQTALLESKTTTIEEVLGHILIKTRQVLSALRCLAVNGRMASKGLIGFGDDDVSLPQRELVVDPSLVEIAVQKKLGDFSGWPVANESQMYSYLAKLIRVLQQKVEWVEHMQRYCGSFRDLFTCQRKIDYLMSGLHQTLISHPKWELSKLRCELVRRNIRGGKEDWIIFLALLGKELGHLAHDNSLFRGAGLAQAACPARGNARDYFSLLASNSQLRSNGWVQPCGGSDSFLTDDVHDLEACEFELSEKASAFLDLKVRSEKQKQNQCNLVTPKTTLAHLVLPLAVLDCLNVAIQQARHYRTLFGEWGLGERVAYGRGVTILFYGPPGTGKTAAAEALANELGKQLLVVDYSQIQNCLLGQTEKNIARAFRDARENDAILFWDEADAMFYDRDSTSHNWEVRDVNVLLVEIERFEGICVLATNRKLTLDKALERRISLKVAFEPPNRAARRQIFERLLPEKLPLDSGIDLESLASAELTGGEIKNVVLNAARRALVRGGTSAHVRMEDFQTAILEIKNGSWAGRQVRSIGFTNRGIL